ncbi:UvrD-helicase domain-containing protein [Pedobacter rhizosphaerae]|uniref:DNA 3'-5' helicase n=1 Tax=Pedobacter rhizosphaerae TaxID=390241 RepID=A0A1H9V6J8_9SPHI|nr:UvrD-helicase domain-containing protein [Pedobacter rhizosphaerae]SES17335.1 ATP-dependent exoDNAse (exonuclease V) beta subunit (contains helicase and exonuclease domains) [Pedobacter rhizosphaerae]
MPKPLKILQASAGSGKTFSLTAHYLTLLFSSENKYREILAVTFTNKATEEMKTRILEVLLGLAQGNPSKKIDDYRQLIIKAYPNFSAADLQFKADKIYRKILHDYSRFSVSTIDGFVQKVIRGFAFELGLNADYNLEMNYDKVKDDLVAKLDANLDHNKQLLQWIIDLAIERISDNKSWNYKLELYNLIGEIFSERFQIFETAVEELGVENIDELFKKYIQVTKEEIKNFEQEIIALATKAHESLQNAGVDDDQLKGKSRNGLKKLILVARGDFSKIESLFSYIDEPDEWFQKNVSLPELYAEINPILQDIKKHYIAHLPNYGLAIAFNKNLYYLRLMQEIAVLLKEYRAENDNLLISDAQKLISGITEDAGDNPSFIWEKVGNRYRNFLFDEFQDTSTSQWGSFKSLLTNAMATPSDDLIDHLIVGDTKQSIYRWRNGDWNILHKHAKRDVGIDNVIEESLEENYRSAENIISFNNFLYRSIPIALQRELNQNIEEKSADLNAWWGNKNYDRIITDIYSQSTQNFASSTLKGGTIKIRKFSKEDAPGEARFTETTFRDLALEDVVSEIQLLITEKKYALKDIAILVRSNSEALLTVKKLMEQNLPVISGDALLIANNAAVKLIINTLKTLVGLDSQNALYKANCIALYQSLRGISAHADHYLNLNNNSISNLSAVLPKTLCDNWQSWLQLPLTELVEILIECYNLKQLTAHLPYLLAFRDLAANANKLGEKGIIAFLTWWDEDGVKKSLPSPDGVDAIQIITIHKSKGLAFRAVFVPFCNWEIKGKPNSTFWVSSEETVYKELRGIPLKYSGDLANSSIAKAYYEELLFNNMDALNMLYVATTRAKDYLYLSTMAKKDATLSNIGDVLNLTFEEHLNENSTYEIVEYVMINSKTDEINHINLDHYPTTGRLSELYVPSEDKHLKHLVNIQQSGRKGSLLHDILASASTDKEIDAYLDDLVMQGIIQISERDALHQSVNEVLQHPDLKAILNSAQESITEKSIIDENGKLHRPDRILIGQDEVIVLDYKFTLEESNKHIEQVQLYKDLLLAMGFENVKTYLFYAVTGKLKAV